MKVREAANAEAQSLFEAYQSVKETVTEITKLIAKMESSEAETEIK